ncbi:MAG: hypothetical protein QOI25_4232 [Mycobacterium sp.]|jgi:uncharacterized protein (DUF1501 family)|nr:hypothetical protein [Mycobacterium sp.]
MAELNRRKFLIAGAGVGAAGLLTGVVAITLPDMLTAARQRPLPVGSGILVIVTLYGGNDGVNTVIPYTNNAYHDARPDLAYAPEEVLPLDGQLALNPALAGLAGLWRGRRLAIVRGVGYPNPDRSHFRSMDIWQTASPKDPVPTGWIGRWLDSGGDDPLRAVNIGAVLPLMSIGEKQVASALSDTIPRIPGEIAATLSALSEDDPRDTAAMSAVRRAYRASKITEPEFGRVVKGIDPTAASETADEDSLEAQLDLVARCVKAAVPTRVYMVSLGGFDTHADERGTQEELLKTVDEALTPFLRQMRTNTYGKKLVVMMYSEFGRRVAANASQGTDHGAAGPVFLAGAPVKGGFYGDEPSLTDLNDGDLKITTDFRDVYHELLSHTLGSDPIPSVGPGRRDIDFL